MDINKSKDSANIILKQYNNNLPLYTKFIEYIETTIKSLINDEQIIVHNINCRLKNKMSLEKKIELKNKYIDISDITDICGVRIITFYADDVDKIATILNNEFVVDKVNSIDKRKSVSPDKFGYVSLHYVIQLGDNRLGISELAKFKNLKVEIQIRTILQHTWAEIEHDLGYKSSIDIPQKIRRNFSRLAGIIELADEEFLRIKQVLHEYSNNVKNEIENESTNLNIDVVTVASFIENDEDYKKFLDSISVLMPVRYDLNDEPSKKILSRIVRISKNFNLKTTKKLKDIFIKYKEYEYKDYESGNIVGIGSVSPLIGILSVLEKADSLEIDQNTYLNISQANLEEELSHQ